MHRGIMSASDVKNPVRLPFVHEMFQEVVRHHAGRIALASSNRQLTYAELDAWSNNIAHYLLKLGAGKGSILCVVAESNFSIIAGMIASLKIGGVFVPLDPHQPERRLKALIDQVPPDYVLTELSLLSKVGSLFRLDVPVVTVDRSQSLGKRPYLLSAREVERLECSTRLPHSLCEPEDMCYIYFTSGSSGKPKAIAGCLKSLSHFIRWEIETFGVVP